MNRRFLPATLAALLVIAALAVAPSTASAQIPSGNTIFACVRADHDGDDARITRVVAATEACKKNEIRIFWNVTGPAGPQGSTGPKGPQGATGAQGPQGETGAVGQDGRSVNFRGAFDPTASYFAFDVVTFEGGAFIATAAPAIGGAPGVDPAWTLLVLRGDTGATGAQGPKGDTGAAGTSITPVTCTVGTFVSSVTAAGTPVCSALSADNLGSGTLSTSVNLNQTGQTAFGTASATVTTTTSVNLPGLTATVNVPTNGLVYVSTSGGTAPAATCTVATCSVVVDVVLVVDGVPVPRGGFQRVYVLDNTAVWGQPNGNWSFGVVLSLSAGVPHTVKLQGRLASSFNAPSGALVSGGDGSALQGSLTVLLLRK